jgi:predicted HicB family RNase H-like nuclease
MKYKGYTGLVELDEEQGILYGRVIGLRDLITFQGDTVPELVRAFQDSVDDYLEFCAQRGEDPEKPYSGNFVVRIEPQLHRTIANEAEAQKVSLNSLIESALEKMFREEAKTASRKGSQRRRTFRAVNEPAPRAANLDRPPKPAANLDKPPKPPRQPKPATRRANLDKPRKARKS